MKYSTISFCLFIFLLFAFSSNAHAQQLVYTPINPNFGGSSFNGAWLMAEANAEKKFTASSSSSSYNPYSNDPLQNFQSNLNSAILSQLSQKIISQVFGENTLNKGHYQFGNYVVDINPQSDGIHISILDNSTGGQTSVIVPFY